MSTNEDDGQTDDHGRGQHCQQEATCPRRGSSNGTSGEAQPEPEQEAQEQQQQQQQQLQFCDPPEMVANNRAMQTSDNCCYLTAESQQSLAFQLLDEQSETPATLSVASNFHGPPSYGTACATLDAGHLQASYLAESELSSRFPLSGCGAIDSLAPAATMGLAPSSSSSPPPQFQPLSGRANQWQCPNSTNLNEFQSNKRFANNGVFLSAELDERANGLRAAGGYPSAAGATLPRIHWAHLNSHGVGPQIGRDGTSGAASVSRHHGFGGAHLRQLERPQHQINLGPDNNLSSYSEQVNSNRQQQQWRILDGPINHVITARAPAAAQSEPWRPQVGNQYYALRVAPVHISNAAQGTGNVIAQPTKPAGQSSQESTHSMREVCSSGGSTVVGSGVGWRQHRADSGQQRAPADRNEQRHQQQQQHPAATTSELLRPRTGPIRVDWNPIQQLGAAQNSRDNQATATNSNLRRSDEDLERVARQQQQLPAHSRRRRRHKSTSGRSESPQSGLSRNSGLATSEATNQPKQRQVTTLGAQKTPYVPKGGGNSVANTGKPMSGANWSHFSLQEAAKSGDPAMRQQAISAHCWLIDSSDDQTYAPARRNVGDGNSKTAVAGSQTGGHLTVAVMKQSQEKQQQRTRPHLGASSGLVAASSVSLSSRAGGARKIGATNLTGSKQSQLYAQDLTTNLKTNSLKMDRILSRKEEEEHRATSNRVGTATLTTRTAMQLKGPTTRSLNRGVSASGRVAVRPRSSSSESSSPRASLSQHRSARTVVRLSALLSFVSNLVKRSPKCPKPSETRKQTLNEASNAGCPARYTAASLAISSSSSSSAYATGSGQSHFSSVSIPSRLFQLANQQQQQQQRSADRLQQQQHPIVLSHLKSLSSGANSSSVNQLAAQSCGSTTASSSMFYSSTSGASGVHQLNPVTAASSSHGYEYCDSNPIVVDETQFGRNQLSSFKGQQFSSVRSNSPANSAATTTSARRLSASSGRESQEALSSSGTGCSGTTANGGQLNETNRLVHVAIMSDNELISNAESAGNRRHKMEHTKLTASVFPAASNNSAPLASSCSQTARQRWRWISLKYWLRRPCNANSNSADEFEDDSRLASACQQADQIEAARYKALRSRRHQRASSSTTLQNIVYLAKADKVFRCRLVASIVVSIILLALVCLLASLIYSRSNAAYQRNKPNLFIDDSDYDLSWLWPPDQEPQQMLTGQQHQQQRSSAQILNAHGGTSAAKSRLFPLASEQSHIGPGSIALTHLDNAMRSKLLSIDRSEKLDQFQQTISHLTNIQLANDNFIDIVQLAKHLEPPSQVSHQQGTNRSGKNIAHDHQQSNETQQPVANKLVTLNQVDYDLVSLTLLSNLHWPLVKWRHQSQQSVANFISLAIAPVARSFGANNKASNQNSLRNLLALLMLSEHMLNNNQTTADNVLMSSLLANIDQFARLNTLLRGAAYHLIGCSYLFQNDRTFRPNLRGKFCKLLLTRYKRMMLTLSQLNHSHLYKLEAPFELALASSGHQQQSRIVSKTLLGYFLDRLALLDVQALAEATLASEEEDENEEFEFETSGLESSSWPASVLNEALDQGANALDAQSAASSLSEAKTNINANNDNDNDNDRSWMPESSVYELAKMVIGESPMKLNLDLSARYNNFQTIGFKIEHSNDHSNDWRQTLASDLLYPWNSFKLPQFVHVISYDLFLHPNLTTKFISGMVKIELQLERPTRYLILNSCDLNLLDLSLWLKVSSPEQARVNQTTVPSANSLKPIPIKRVLISSKLEQIYIELYSQLEPTSQSVNWPTGVWTPSSSAENGASNGPSQVSFGGELPLQERAAHRTNQFVINISFNRTNLMDNDGSEEQSKANQQQQKAPSGLEFIQYGDYFAQPETELKTLLFAQFEPTNARKLFPCFDEPHFKAKFQLNLVHETDQQALFNAPKRERVPYIADGSLQMSVFETTPIPLCTYLVSFLICDSQNIKSITSRVAQYQQQQQRNGAAYPTKWPSTATPIAVSSFAGLFGSNQDSKSSNVGQEKLVTGSPSGNNQRHIQVQILAQFEHLSQAEFASQLVPQLLAFYQTHLQFAYPMDKLDLIAIPKSSQSNVPSKQQQSLSIFGGRTQIDTMESMGLIWFKAPLLLVDTNLISQNLIEQISLIMSHQLAHQYFGNIVSIRNWHDLWLYESLCQYLESIALSSVQTDWKLDEQFVVTTIQDTLAMEQFELDTELEPSMSPILDQTTNLLDNESDTKDVDQSNARALNIDPSFDASNFETELLKESVDGPMRGTQSQPFFSSQELKKGSALFHMLFFNLLPSFEAQARLLGRCLSVYRYKTMSRHQFWRLFGEQLSVEASLDRLTLDLETFMPINHNVPISSNDSPIGSDIDSIQITKVDDINHSDRQADIVSAALPDNHATNISVTSTPIQQAEQMITAHQGEHTSNERVVFVRPAVTASSRTRWRQNNQSSHIIESLSVGQLSKSDAHKIRVRSTLKHRLRLADNLDIVVDAWLRRPGYPLITASTHRDRIHLKQERFSFNWWHETNQDGHDTQDERQSAATTAKQSSGRLRRRSPVITSGELEAGDVWPIPLMLVSRYNPKVARFFWMGKREMELPFDEQRLSLEPPGDYAQLPASSNLYPANSKRNHHYSAPGTWFKLNVNQSSLVRVNYDERNWEALTDLLVKSHYSNHLLSSLDRANLIDDALTLMRCGKLSVGVAMNLTLYLEVAERDYMPWTSALRHLDQMQTLLNQNPLWHRYVLKLMQPISSVIGWKDDGPHLMRKLRRSLFGVALQYGDEKTVNKAKQEFKNWFKNNRFIVPNLQELVYVAGVRYGDQQEWFYCWQKYQQLVALDSPGSSISNTLQQVNKTSSGSTTTGDVFHGLPSSPVAASTIEPNEPNAENEKRQLLTGLASTQNTWLLEQFLNSSLNSTKIEAHHLKHVMQTLGKNPVARLYLWRFVRLNWFSLAEKSTHLLEIMVIESTKHFASRLDYDEVEAFFVEKRAQNSIKTAMEKSLQTIRSNIYWRDYIEPELTKWLSQHVIN